MAAEDQLDVARLRRRLERERKARLAAEEIAEHATRAALHDPLTGLPNRALLMDRLETGLARSQRHSRLVAVFFLDLDRFKLVNDSLGHGAGDRLLIEVARRLRHVTRPSDTVARLGGDEFAILSEDWEDRDAVEGLAERLIAALAPPVGLGSKTVFTTASIGVALASSGSPHALLRDADAAMYAAKQRGKARYEMFDEAMRERTVGRLELENELRIAIERGDLSVEYQPIVDLRAGAIAGVEALARWRHLERGTISPLEFIPVAEETGLIIPLGSRVLEQACADAQRWNADRPDRPLYVSVNVSAIQLSRADLADTVARVAAARGADPRTLCLEVTESVLMTDAVCSASNVEALDRLGVRLAMDDFGKGYSSLTSLKRLPVDLLKIDRSFVTDLGHDREDTAIIAAVVALARALDLTIVAEGIETEHQRDTLRALGCDLGQGFLFSRPVPVASMDRLLRESGSIAPAA